MRCSGVDGEVFATDNTLHPRRRAACATGFVEGHEIECPLHQGTLRRPQRRPRPARRPERRAGRPTRPGSPATGSSFGSTEALGNACLRPGSRDGNAPSSPITAAQAELLSCGSATTAPMLPVITSLLDTDLYKFTMWQAMLHRHPQTQAEYTFVCRNDAGAIRSPSCVARASTRELDALCALRFRPERARLPAASLRFIRSTSSTSCASSTSSATSSAPARADDGSGLEIVASGPQVHVMAFEIHRARDRQRALLPPLRPGRGAAPKAAPRSPPRSSACASSRSEPKRRHAVRVLRLRRAPALLGASGSREVARSRSSARCRSSSRAPPTCCSRATSAWCRSARWRTSTCRPTRRSACACATSSAPRSKPGSRSTAATSASRSTDVVGMDAFLADFDLYFAKLFDGLRHDSGDPVAWGEKALAHYEKLRIDPHTKRAGLLRRPRLRQVDRALSPLRRPRRSAASASAPTSPTTWA